MELTASVLKADIGSPGGHTKPRDKVVDAVRATIAAQKGKLLTDFLITFTGDDIAIIMTHERGHNDTRIHQLAWAAFQEGTGVAQKYGDYAAGQDLLVDAPSGNIRGAGPAVAEIVFDHDVGKHNQIRPAESMMIFAADKCGPGAYNLIMYKAFAETGHAGGMILKPEMTHGFRFRIMDMDWAQADRLIDLDTPGEDRFVQALLRNETRYGIESIWSRKYPDQQVAAISTMRLHNIAGKYTGKDDPVAIVRTQGIFPAPEEITSPFRIVPYVTGDARGSHVMPLTPYAINSPVRLAYCQPIVSGIAISLDPDGNFSEEYVDMFADQGWDRYREKAGQKADAMREQEWFGVAMANEAELAYTGLSYLTDALASRWFDVAHEEVLAPASD